MGAGAEITDRGGDLLLGPPTPIAARMRLHPDDRDDPFVIRVDFTRRKGHDPGCLQWVRCGRGHFEAAAQRNVIPQTGPIFAIHDRGSPERCLPAPVPRPSPSATGCAGTRVPKAADRAHPGPFPAHSVWRSGIGRGELRRRRHTCDGHFGLHNPARRMLVPVVG